MRIALVTLSEEGTVLLGRLQAALPEADAFVHRSADPSPGIEPFDSVVELTGRIFGRYEGIVYVLPCGVAVRAVAPHLESKKTDPAVVVVDVAGRWSVSLLSGHEGGANRLAVRVANVLGAEPVVSTTTEARKTLIAGIGGRRGVATETILDAIARATESAGAGTDSSTSSLDFTCCKSCFIVYLFPGSIINLYNIQF